MIAQSPTVTKAPTSAIPLVPRQLLVQIIRYLSGGDSNDRLTIETGQGHMPVELGMIGTQSTGRRLLETDSLRSPCPETFPAGRTRVSPQQAFRPITTLSKQQTIPGANSRARHCVQQQGPTTAKLPVKLSFVELFFSAHPADGIRPAVTPTINMVIRAVDAVYGLALLNRTNQVPSLDLIFLK